MGLLPKYILREFMKIFLLTLALLVLIYLAIHFFGLIGRFVQKDASFQSILYYFLLKTPQIVFDVSPLAILIGTVITLGIFSHHNEIVAMKSNGLSLLYLTAPILGLAVILSVMLGWGGARMDSTNGAKSRIC